MYKNIPIEKKIEAVNKVLGGKPLLRVAKEYRVNRNSLHFWVKKAQKGIKKALILGKRGPRLTVGSFRRKESEIKEIRARCNKLKEEVKEVRLKAAEIRQNNNEPRPEKCPACGCEKSYKNGTYEISRQRLISLIKKTSATQFKVQQFICGYCARRLGFKLNNVILPNK